MSKLLEGLKALQPPTTWIGDYAAKVRLLGRGSALIERSFITANSLRPQSWAEHEAFEDSPRHAIVEEMEEVVEELAQRLLRLEQLDAKGQQLLK